MQIDYFRPCAILKIVALSFFYCRLWVACTSHFLPAPTYPHTRPTLPWMTWSVISHGGDVLRLDANMETLGCSIVNPSLSRRRDVSIEFSRRFSIPSVVLEFSTRRTLLRMIDFVNSGCVSLRLSLRDLLRKNFPETN